MNNRFVVFALIAMLAAAGGFLAAMLLSAPSSEPDSTVYGAGQADIPQARDLIGTRRPDFTLSDNNGNLVSASDYDGKVLLLNFWASWCKPCVDEMPMLSRLQEDYESTGLQVLGIALDDAARASEFASGLELSYPVLVGKTDVVLTGRRYGNSTGMLPFSVLVDTFGEIRWAHLGSLSRAQVEQEIHRLRSD